MSGRTVSPLHAIVAARCTEHGLPEITAEHIAERVMDALREEAEREAEAPALHLWMLQFRPISHAEWGSPFPYADSPMFDAPEEAQAEATCGGTGQTRLACYALVDIGETITLPVDVPAEAPAARVTG